MKLPLFVLLLLTLFERGVSCPTGCFCSTHSSGYYVYCYNERLGYIPTDLPNTTYYLELAFHNIETVDVEFCLIWPNLQTLNLRSNLLQSVPPDVFNGCSNLLSLYLNSNRINFLNSTTFKNLLNLKTLDISYNDISQLDKRIFQDLSNLKNLYIQNNDITIFDPALFQSLNNLTTLDISGNRISQLDTHIFQNLSNLEYLYIQNTDLTILDPVLFQTLENLKTLDVENNKIPTLNANIIVWFKKLETLDVSGNLLTVFDTTMFQNLSNFRYLYLGSNSLTTIDSHLINSMPNIYRIELQSNEIQRINTGTFANLSIVYYIYLHSNKISVIEENSFQNLPALGYLYLSNNRLSVIDPDMLTAMPNLYWLSISDNQIQNISSGTFAGLSNLYELYLHSNKISMIEDDSFKNLTTLRYVNLQGNKLSLIDPDILMNMPNIYDFNVADNIVEQIRSRTFVGLSNLYYLSLQSNKISVIEEDSFVNLTRLQYLYLQNNMLKSIKQHTLVNLPDLRTLDLRDNNISQIEREAFGNLSSLSTLNLNSNPLNCDCNIFYFWTWIIERPNLGITAQCSDGRYVLAIRTPEVDKCDPDNCKCENNGTCILQEDGKTICSCVGNWTGESCTVSQCEIQDCGNLPCYIESRTGSAKCYNELQMCLDTTTDTSTNSAAVTTTISTTTVPTTQSTPTTTPCPSTGVLNRTNKVLDEECGEYGSDSKCIVENSGCMQSYTDRVWRCRCARGYVKMNQQCVHNPGRIFSSRGPLVKTIRGDTPIGETVFTIDRSEISGFLLENTQPLEIIGEKSTMFSTEISSNSIIVKVNGNLETRKYNLFLFASVQIDDSGLNDFVEMQITVTPESLIPEDIIILDGTPKGVVVGHLCDSCLSESTQPTVENSDLVKVNNDGSIVTTRLVSIDTLQSQVTIAYSTDIHVRIENNFRINITLTIARAQYTIQLNEDSTSSTQVGILNLQHSFQLQNDEFQVNGNSLNLGSKTNLDYEQKTEVTKSLSFSLTGKTTHTINIVINIKVINVNDEVPKFTQTMYSFRSVQTAYTDLVIGFVLANDPDSGSQLQYSTTPSDVLTVDNNGVVSIIKSVSSRTYNATVDVRDGKYSDTAKIFIEFLQPTNVNLGKEFTGTIAENKPSGTYVTSASEPGYNNFQFTDQAANNHFSIDSVTGQIASTRSFDRENEGDRSFKYTVVANKENEASCSLVVIGEVIITITDENDEPPVFVNTHYNATVIEEATGIVLTMSTAISTSDKDLNPTVSYSLSGFHASKFSIEAATGIMKTIQAIDREIIPSLDVNVVANDGKNTASAVVYVTIADINDNPPKFSSNSYSFSVDENVPSGTRVNEVIATDADIGKNAVLTFDIISDGGYFRINQTTGEITVNGDLDRETLETYNVTVIARDNGDTINSADVTVSITVKDVNDNPPVFPNDRITINFEENKSCNTPITAIKATDADKPGTTNSLITYTLLSGTDKFTIDGNSGELKCISLIDYESDKSFTVYVRAEDRATSGKLSSNLTVIIQITDVNDNSPQFMDPRSSLTIRYFTSQSRVIDAFSVTDKDSAENGMITMSVAGTASAFLEIDNNGILRTIVNTNPINKQYNLVVTAVDHGNPQLSATHTLNVTVNKDTTHVVTFEDQVMGMTVMENSGIGTSVGEVASNVKLSQTGITLEYEIWDEDDEISFSISSSSGIITSKKLIDREEIAEHEFVVRVKNAASDEQSDLAVVHIDITDVNDNPPIFERDNYYYTISENSEPDHQVQPASVKVKASDQDTGENAAIEYKIIERAGCKSKFKLRTEADGSQAIVLANKIDYEEIRTCEFAIKAENTNNNSMSSTTEIDVNILDYNDNAPEFLDHDNNVYMLDVPEDTTINTEILPFGGLQDKDSRENGDIILSIVNKDCTFDASNEGMRIKVKLQSGASLDYESGHRSYICLLKAEDRGQPVMSSSATLSISVTDVNDNKPMISNAVFSVNVSRESDPGYIIVNSISASDADSGDNGKLVYSIQGSAYLSNFKIDVDTGKISINSPLTSIQEDQIVLRVIVADKGIPRLESLAQVTIFIKDDNPRPYLEPTNPIRIQENTLLPEGIITTVKAFDRKKGKETICDCTFTLQSTNRDDIVIDNTTGVIRFKNPNGYFDRENEPNGQVSVVVIATDKDDPPKDSRPGVVTVIIGDMNDQFPIFTEQQYNFEVFQKAPVGTFVGRVSAVDRDLDPITHYSIQISSSIFTQSVLSIDQLTGKITKTGNLTLDQTANFQLQAYVYAADSKDPAKNATFANVIVTILFDDKNNHTPKFQQESYKSTLDWSAPPGTTVIEIIATDDDTEEEGIVSYSIVSGNDRGFFALDGNGKLTLVYQLDSSLGTGSQIYKTLIVKAMDGGVIPKSSTASILVTISGENPGVSVQGTAHSKALNDSENERQKWSTALYVLVALLCIAIMCSLFLLYKWRTAPAPSSDREPFDTDKRKYFSNEQYSDLGKRNTVEYSQSNEAFVDPYSRPTDEPSNEPIPDYPVYDWQTQETRVLPAVASNQT